MTACEPVLRAVRIAAGEPLDDDDLAWLRVGFQRWLRGDGTAEHCFRLTGGNRMAARNAALVRAARILDAGQGQSAWHLAELVRQAIVRFESVIIERIHRGDAGELSAVDAALRDAFASGAQPLRSQQRIYDQLAPTFNAAEH